MQKSVNMKREKVENCEICGSKFRYHQLQYVTVHSRASTSASDAFEQCAGIAAKIKRWYHQYVHVEVLKTAQVDKEKHRLCNICKADAINQKKIRDEVPFLFYRSKN
jgi:hypothetical protein